MSLGDVLGFEKFHFKDFFDRLKDDPKRLLLGVDPASTTMWNKLLGKDDEALFNVWGGPMGGGTLGTDKTGGVYERAGAAGLDTGTSAQSHTIAEQIAAMFAMNYGADKLGGFMGIDEGSSMQGSDILGQAQNVGGMVQGGNLPLTAPRSGQESAEEAARRAQAEELLRQALRLEAERQARALQQQQPEVRYFA